MASLKLPWRLLIYLECRLGRAHVTNLYRDGNDKEAKFPYVYAGVSLALGDVLKSLWTASARWVDMVSARCDP